MMAYDVRNFQQEVVERSHTVPVLVDFWAEWCGPCKILGPVLERLSTKSEGEWILAKVDTEEHTDIARSYRIQSIPNVKLFVDGNVVNEFVGALPEHQIQRWLQTAVPSKHRQRIRQAEALLAAGNDDAARTILEEIIVLEPGNAGARILLAKSLALSDPHKAADLLNGFDDPKYSDIVDAIQTTLHLRDLAEHTDQLAESDARQHYVAALKSFRTHDFDSALKNFIEVIRQDRYFDDDGARKACLAMFKLLGEEHPVVQKHRRDFSSALY